jgi:hypothetical protein
LRQIAAANDSSTPARAVDPFHLPARQIAPDGMPVIVDRASVTFAPNDPVRSRRVAMSDYAGIAVRIVLEDGDRLRATIELLHQDRVLSVTLAHVEAPEDAAADWQAWGKALNLPLLLVSPDGRIETAADRPGALAMLRPKPRRRHSFFAGRRPRFLTRRKSGHRQAAERIAGREIIARD